MKILRFSKDKKIRYGVISNRTVKVIKGTPFSSIEFTGETCKLSEVKILAPTVPSKIVCMGLNYKKHAEETHMPIPANPLIFLKPPTTIINPEDNIVYPAMSKRVDYEGELAIVMKKKASLVSREKALDYVLGYTCFNDTTARDLQNVDGQWTRAKGFDTFGAIGPWIETDVNPDKLPVETYLNGELKQQGNTSDLIFSIRDIISFISQVMTLLPGDVIATGTPSGIGPMNPGDTIEIKIAPIGTLRNYIVKP
jgi:2-keto-4-pentenoate hydratase/2-oxohepta-3-ene-1,7-dioic acid hydratase in catechol pathway